MSGPRQREASRVNAGAVATRGGGLARRLRETYQQPTGHREMLTGTIVKYIGEKGYFFIQPDAGGKDVFAHARAATSIRPYVGMKVLYEIEETVDGRIRARSVSEVGRDIPIPASLFRAT